MLRRPVLIRLAAAAAFLVPASLAAKPGAPSPHSPSKPLPIPSHKQKLAAPPCGLHDNAPKRVVATQDRRATKIKPTYALGAIGETIKLKAKLQLTDGTPIAFKSVEFKVENQVIGTVKSDSKGLATIDYKVPNKFGPKSWSARYSGNNLCKGSTGSSSVGTVRAPTEITIDFPPKYANVGSKMTFNARLKRTTDNTSIVGREVEAYVGGVRIAKVATGAGGRFTIDYVPVGGSNKLDIKLQFLGDVLYNPKVTVASMPLYPPRQTVYIRGASFTGYYKQTLNTAVVVSFGPPLTGPKFAGAPVRVWYGSENTTPFGKGTTNSAGIAVVTGTLHNKPGVYNIGAFADVARELYNVNNSVGNIKLTVLKAPVTVSAVGPSNVAIGATVNYAVKVVRTTDKKGAAGLKVCMKSKCATTDASGRATVSFTVSNAGGTGPRTFSFTSETDDYHLAGIRNVAVQVTPSTN